jgi:hypothetical protein
LTILAAVGGNEALRPMPKGTQQTYPNTLGRKKKKTGIGRTSLSLSLSLSLSHTHTHTHTPK